jgi:hypothetical protein
MTAAKSAKGVLASLMVLVAGATLLIACGGGQGGLLDTPVATAPTATQTAAPAKTATLAKTTTPAKPTATPKASPTPHALRFAEVTPVAVQLPPGTPVYLTGESNREAEDELRAVLAGAGIPSSVYGLLVLPVTGTNQSILCISTDETSSNAVPQDSTPMLKALVSAPAIKDANITRVNIYYTSQDAQGRLMTLFSIPIDTVRALANGTSLTADMLATIKTDTKRLP